jgi:hypothetical protein
VLSALQLKPPCVFVLVAPWAANVTTPGGTLATSGASFVDINGSHLGVNATTVFLSYNGGSTGFAARTYTTAPGSCTVVEAGARLHCASQPGVGANFTFVVHVDGAASDASVDTVSYAPPTIMEVVVPGVAIVPTAGGVTVVIRGSNFGPVAGSTALRVWSAPSADQTDVFFARNCGVVEAHSTIQCTLDSLVGAKMDFRVRVEGQDNTLPQVAVAPPRVTRVALAGGAFASTVGGTRVVVEGDNFGDRASKARVVFLTPGGVLDALNCTLVTNHTLLECALPAGTGVISRVSVTVVDQTGSLDVTGIAYAPPTIASVAPAAWPTDVSSMIVTVTGSGFGGASQSSQVSVTARAVGSRCTDAPDGMILTATRVSVLSDTELSFSFRSPAAHVAASWALTVMVAGQGLAVEDVASADASVVPTLGPSAPAITFAAPSNGTHSFLLLSGSNYGPVVSSCANDASVTVGRQPCDRLTVVQVWKVQTCSRCLPATLRCAPCHGWTVTLM